jgi:16S rRNA A1518/A1519 N6-dimethyltransferase RsmA/KsgA/DIM1 with predicted DNA glycosylase/AP lyase activity
LPALEALQQAVPKGRLNIVHGDMLTLDEAKMIRLHHSESEEGPLENANIKLIGNLPFNIGTQLILKWLHQIENRRGPFVHSCKFN